MISKTFIVLFALLINGSALLAVEGIFSQEIRINSACLFCSGFNFVWEAPFKQSETPLQSPSTNLTGSYDLYGNSKQNTGRFVKSPKKEREPSAEIASQMSAEVSDNSPLTDGHIQKLNAQMKISGSNTIITVSIPKRTKILKKVGNQSEEHDVADFILQVEGNKTNEMNSDKNSTSAVTINLSGQPAKLSVHATANLKKDSNLSGPYKGKNTITFLFH